MSTTTGMPTEDAALVSGILERITRDLSTILGHELPYSVQAVERHRTRPAGRGQVHISFKLGLQRAGEPKRFGSLLVPLPEAIAMACFLLMIPEQSVATRRQETSLDTPLKDALLEIGSVIGSSGNTALASFGAGSWSLRSEGCQGVRADVRPAFEYEEGDELVVARAVARIGPFESFELLLMIPPLG